MHQYKYKTILVVEDFEDNRFMMRSLLEMSGYKVIEACNGREAVEIAKRKCPDLVLMDVSLPEMDGINATRHIRQIQNLCNVPIVIVSAHGTKEFQQVAREAGSDAYMVKPIDYDYLDALICKLLDKKEMVSNMTLVA
jgi:two-component system, cell cycle response regulator DivK